MTDTYNNWGNDAEPQGFNTNVDIMATYGSNVPMMETNWDDPDTDEEVQTGVQKTESMPLTNQNPLDHLVETIKKESNDKPERSRSRSRSRSRDRRRRRKRRSDSRSRSRSRSGSSKRSRRNRDRDRRRSRSPRDRKKQRGLGLRDPDDQKTESRDRHGRERTGGRKGRSIFQDASPKREFDSDRDRRRDRDRDRDRDRPRGATRNSELEERNNRMLFVRGLADSHTKDHLVMNSLFASAIEIKMSEGYNGKHKGFAHITFRTAEEVENCVKEYDEKGCTVLGQNLYLDFVGAKARQNPGERQEKKMRTIFVRAIPRDSKLEEIKNSSELFKRATRIEMAYEEGTQPDAPKVFRGFCHVEFRDRRECEDAMKIYRKYGLTINGKSCFIDYSGGNPRQSWDDREARKRRTLFVRSIPYDATEDLIRCVPCFRDSIDIRMAKSKETGKFRGFCHVEFGTQGEADAAMIYYDNRGINILGKSVAADYVGDNARQTEEQKEMARIKAEQKRARKRESDALEKLLTAGGDPSDNATSSGVNPLDALLASAKANSGGGPNNNKPINNPAVMAHSSSGISANNRYAQKIQSGQVDGGRNPRWGNQNERFDPYANANSHFNNNNNNNNWGGNQNKWNNNNNNNGYQNNHQTGYNQNNNNNQGGYRAPPGGGYNPNNQGSANQPKKKPNAAFGGLLM